MNTPWLFWHRRDLRLADNLGLAQLAARTTAVTGLVVLEPSLWEEPAAAPSRLWFLLTSVAELQEAWRRAGSQLLVLQGDPLHCIPQLADRLGVVGLALNEDVEPGPRQRDEQLQRVLQRQGVAVQRCWDQLLVPPEQVVAGSGEPYKVYGHY
ncbi:MAG: deoxyribodipyrimidine photolyase, partial [Synechococcus sp. SB0676_bin_10]|nr:deoxyribodipyrimidine photolyase [Synechococcus sp. SB0676_bin_10]